MAKNLKEALIRNQAAAKELDQALRDCIAHLRKPAKADGGERLRLVQGGRGPMRRA